jgi:predicted DNA-binding transcriptional regulator AlpA
MWVGKANKPSELPMNAIKRSFIVKPLSPLRSSEMHTEYMTAREAADYVGLSESYLAKLRMGVGKVSGPAFILIGLRGIRYKRADLDKWMDARTVPAFDSDRSF